MELAPEGTCGGVTEVIAPLVIVDPEPPSQAKLYELKSWIVATLRLAPFLSAVDFTLLSSVNNSAQAGITIGLEAVDGEEDRLVAARGHQG